MNEINEFSFSPTPVTEGAYGKGIASFTLNGELLDVWFNELNLINSNINSTFEVLDVNKLSNSLQNLISKDEIRQTETKAIEIYISSLQSEPKNGLDIYLRLHLLSHRLVLPNSINLDNIFTLLPNVVWTNQGPCSTKNFETIRPLLKTRNTLTVYGVDKFPRMVDYVLPSQVRIADADRVRLGAYLAPGTTVMHEGFVNYNAGTLGKSMVEGRISAGVIVGADSDIGGGASIMGTLSGGGKERITIGSKTLLGANSGLGISLGDNCILEAGLYLTAGTKVKLTNNKIITARELSGIDNHLFRRNSTTGVVEAIELEKTSLNLNSVLHDNN